MLGSKLIFFSVPIRDVVMITRSLVLLVCIVSSALAFQGGPCPGSFVHTPDPSVAARHPTRSPFHLSGLSAGLSDPSAPQWADRTTLASRSSLLSKFFPLLPMGIRTKNVRILRAEGRSQDGMPQTDEATDQIGDANNGSPLSAVPARTLQQVREVLAKLKLHCPFPSENLAREDFFEALLHRLADLEEWATRYDMRDEHIAGKQVAFPCAFASRCSGLTWLLRIPGSS
eukprot:1542296-Rhodomonas_salina.1